MKYVECDSCGHREKGDGKMRKMAVWDETFRLVGFDVCEKCLKKGVKISIRGDQTWGKCPDVKVGNNVVYENGNVHGYGNQNK